MSTDPPLKRATVRAVAQAGNAVALFAILVLLVNSTLLFTTTAPLPPPPFKGATSERLLLVVIDGLRVDAVAPVQMPQVHALAQRGSFRVSQVDALIPSTVAGLRALIEGVIVPPAEFVNNFRTRSAPQGGLIQAVHAAGGRVFAAGPHLWTDLYGDWLAGSLSVSGLARDDPAVLRAAQAACSDPQWQLVIVQFCQPDVMAHLHGTRSREYAESVAWCDRAVGELIRHLDERSLIVITSDHGVTVAGGHAGAEPDVLKTPLITNNAALAPDLPQVIPQTHIPFLLADALGLQMKVPEAKLATANQSRLVFLSIVTAVVGGLAVLCLLSTASDAFPPQNGAFWLNTAVWGCLAAAWLNPWAAFLFSLLGLLAFAWRFRSRVPKNLLLYFLVGIALGAVRIAAPWWAANASLQPSFLHVTAICLAALGLGRVAGKAGSGDLPHHRIWLGAGLIVASPALSGLLGESVSLSSLDVRLAFHLIESPLGLAGAVSVAAVRPVLPMLFLVSGLLWGWRGRREPETSVAPIAVGAGAVIAGELSLASVTFAAVTSQSASALALGLLLRECALILVLFPVLTGMVILLRTCPESCHDPVRPRSHPFHRA